MSARHTPSFGHGLGAAFVLSIGGAAVPAMLSAWLGGAAALRVVIALLGFAYVLYVIGRSGERVGRITTIACWSAAASSSSEIICSSRIRRSTYCCRILARLKFAIGL